MEWYCGNILACLKFMSSPQKKEFMSSFHELHAKRRWILLACLSLSHQVSLTIFREDRPQLVGWPPVRTFRKNLSATSTRPAYSEDLSKVGPCYEEEDHGNINTGVSVQERPAMFVKVNLEGYAVGRKIDLKAHCGYGLLSSALQSMFHGFLSGDNLWFALHCTPTYDHTPSCHRHIWAAWLISDGHGRIATREDEEQLEYHKGKGTMKNYILLYEDNEGDRMLVGDVPWE